MSLNRNWRGISDNQKAGLTDIHELAWVQVLIKRTIDQNLNVGVTAELDEQDEEFEIKARIDPITSDQNGKIWLGLVETHILPLMRKNDRWFIQSPLNDSIQVFRVVSIDNDEIMLNREY